MKKFILLSLLALTTVLSFANIGNPSINSGADTSFPNYQKFGSPTTLTDFPGAPRATKGLILGYYADTATANNVSLGNYIKFYPYAQIATLNPANTIWIRNATATAWIQLGGGSSPTNVFYTYGPSIDSLWTVINGITTLLNVSDAPCGIIVPGTVFWDSTLVFHVSPSTYRLCCDGIRRTSANTYITLPAAHATLNKFVAIIVDSNGVNYVEGTPAASAAEPQLDDCQLLLTMVYVPAGSLVPGNGSNGCGLPTTEIIYDQTGGSEWTPSASIVTVNFSNTTNPYRFTIAADVGAFSTFGSSFSFTRASTINITQYSAVTFFIRLKSNFSNNTSIGARFLNSSTSQGSSTVFIQGGQYNFVRTLTGSYQTITIPISAFVSGALTTVVDKLSFFLYGSNTQGFYIDYIQLQEGVCQPKTSGLTGIASGNLSPLFTTSITNANPSIPKINYSLTSASANTVFGNNSAITAQPSYIPISSLTSVNNGLVKNSSGVIQLDSNGVNPLTRNVLIDATSGFNFNITGAKSDHTLQVTNSGTGNGITVVGNTSGYGVYSTGATGVQGNSANGFAVVGNATVAGTGILGDAVSGQAGYFRINPTSTNTTVTIATFQRLTSGTAAANIAGQIEMSTETTDGSATTSNSFISKLTTPTTGAEVSQFIITGKNAGATVDKLYIGGAATQINATRFETYAGAAVAAANDLTLGTDGNLFSITGVTQINAITTANWQAGSQIAFIFTGTPTLKNNTAGGAGTAPMLLAGRVDFVAAAGDYIALQYDGTNWYETNRKLAASGGVYAFSNGITESPAGTVKWGGTLTGSTTITQSTNPIIFTSANVSGTTTTSSLVLNNNSITSGTGLYVASSSLSSGSLIDVAVASTAAASNLQKGINVSLSGANATGSQTTKGIAVSNIHSGTNPLNYGVYSIVDNGSSSSSAIYGESTNGRGVTGIATTTGNGVRGDAGSGAGVFGVSSSGQGVSGLSTTGYGGYFQVAPTSTNTIVSVLGIDRTSTGTAGNGIGGAITFTNKASDAQGYISSQIVSTWTDVTVGTRTGDLQFFTTNSTTTALKLAITGDGRVYGSALHNNAGAVTGTTNQYVASGTFTPTLFNTTNVSASTAYVCQWMRVGNVVTVSGKVDIDASLAAATELGMSLPIASSMTAEENLGGSAVSSAAASLSAAVKGDATNDRVLIAFIATSLTNDSYYFEYSYVIL